MAFWQRRAGKVRILTYDSKAKRQVVLPRSQSEHLDDLSDTDVEDWVRRWSNIKEVTTKSPKAVPVKEPNILSLVDRFKDYLAKNEGKHPTTCDEYRRCLVNHALPYFINTHGCERLADFSSHAKGLTTWLGHGVSPKHIKRINPYTGSGAGLSRRV